MRLKIKRTVLTTLLLCSFILTALPTNIAATTGRYQQFDNGTIHSSNLGTFATIGRLNEIHASGGGTATYGFPTGEMYVKDGIWCQMFEMGELCEDKSACNPGEIWDGGGCILPKTFLRGYEKLIRLEQNNYSGCIPVEGCAVVALSMAMQYFDIVKSPDTIMQENGGCYMSWNINLHSGNRLGIRHFDSPKVELYERIRDAINNSQPVIAWSPNLPGLSDTHFVVIYGYDRDYFYVLDPYNLNYQKIAVNGPSSFYTIRTLHIK